MDYTYTGDLHVFRSNMSCNFPGSTTDKLEETVDTGDPTLRADTPEHTERHEKEKHELPPETNPSNADEVPPATVEISSRPTIGTHGSIERVRHFATLNEKRFITTLVVLGSGTMRKECTDCRI